MEFFTLQTANKADLYRKKELRLTDSIIQTQSVLNVTFFGHREKKKKTSEYNCSQNCKRFLMVLLKFSWVT